MIALEVREAGRKQYEFLALLGHELRNPLAAITAALKVLRRCGDDGTTRDLVQGVLERQTHQLGCLIEQLQEFTRLNNGKTQLQKRLVDLAQVVNLAIETVQPCIDERRHVLEVALPPVTLETDPTRLAQVLTNLLENAAKYTDPCGRIWLTVEPTTEAVVLRVRDTGIGITPEMLPHVFELFVQSDRVLSRSRGGLGIGLALVRRLVEALGGNVSAFSAGLGEGSEFVVCLPRTTSSEKHNGTPFAEEYEHAPATWDRHRGIRKSGPNLRAYSVPADRARGPLSTRRPRPGVGPARPRPHLLRQATGPAGSHGNDQPPDPGQRDRSVLRV